jgi:glyoxylase-like metal-dependent hydrolase (beta-lactamase superfamily II)
MKLDKISDRIYANTKGETGGNVGIIVLDKRVVAVDAQYPVSGADFRNSIPDYTDKPVSHLLLTHIHGDHIFGNQAFEDCEIVAHRRLKEKMEENLHASWAPSNLEKMLEEVRKTRPDSAWLYEGLRIVLPTETFDNKYNIDGVEMWHLPGHTDGSSIVYIPDDRVLFAGDTMFAKTFPWGGDPTADPDEWIESYKAIIAMDVDVIVPGHGPLCGKDEFEIQLAWFEAVKEEMKRLLAAGASEEEVVEFDGYPDFYESEGERRPNTLRQWYKVWLDKV